MTAPGPPTGPVIRRRAAVLGHPIGHSLSPVMHRAAYAALGLTAWDYSAWDVDEDGLGGFLERLDAGWAGFSVTMPLKRAVRPYLVDLSELAEQVGAVNTVVVEASAGGVRLHGYNTDVYGIIHALGEVGVESLTRCLVLGGGATAASTLAAVRDLGCDRPVVLVRSRDRAAPLLEAAERLGVRVELDALDPATVTRRVGELADAAAVVSTLPAGAADGLVDAPAVPASSGRVLPPLLDVCYHPWPTPLAQAWQDHGGAVVGGFSMLVHQAEGQVRLMTGQRPPLDVMRSAGQLELARRAGRSD